MHTWVAIKQLKWSFNYLWSFLLW